MSERGNWNSYHVGWETHDDSELVGTYSGESEAVVIREAKEEIRDAGIKVPHAARWIAVAQ